MAKNKISEYSAVASNNTDIGNIDINEGCAPANVNNAIRELMAQLKDQQDGTDGDNFTVGGNLSVTGTSALIGNATVTGTLTANGGLTGNVTGNLTGAHNGTVGATTPNTGAFTTASASSGFTGTLTGNVTGNLTGNVTGNVTGTVTGNVTGSSGSCTGNSATATYAQLISGTLVTTTSGTSVDFTGIPSWVKRVTVMFSGVSINGTSAPILKLGTSGGLVSSGYLGMVESSSGATQVSLSSYWALFYSTTSSASHIFHGNATFTLLGNNTWTGTTQLALSNSTLGIFTTGSVDIGGTLTQLSISTIGGVNTFDAGLINIIYE